jgi:pimeloyl-ACP methyl ester carboxylesterase
MLADRFHLIAPDLPGFGFSGAPERSNFSYTFDNQAKVVAEFTSISGFDRMPCMFSTTARLWDFALLRRVRIGSPGSFHRMEMPTRRLESASEILGGAGRLRTALRCEGSSHSRPPDGNMFTA